LPSLVNLEGLLGARVSLAFNTASFLDAGDSVPVVWQVSAPRLLRIGQVIARGTRLECQLRAVVLVHREVVEVLIEETLREIGAPSV
jgi:hypothetical protein